MEYWDVNRLKEHNDTINQIVAEMSAIAATGCGSDSHDLVTVESYTGGKEYRCRKCGITPAVSTLYHRAACDFHAIFSGSYVDGNSFKWHPEEMDVTKIVKLEVSYGDRPIQRFTVENDKITFRSCIDGSRDGGIYGGKNYHKDYFKPCTKRLRPEHITALVQCLSETSFSVWSTRKDVFERTGACGSSILNTFHCEFANGRSFTCYEALTCHNFRAITQLLANICSSFSDEDDDPEFKEETTVPEKEKSKFNFSIFKKLFR